jgi:hypothetical protein
MRILYGVMSHDDDDKEKGDPVDDLRKGFGLLFRAAKGAVERLPTKNAEELVVTGAKEVGRAIENVASTIEKHVLKKDAPPTEEKAKADGAAETGDDAKANDAQKAEPSAKTSDTNEETHDDPPKRGPRVDV